MQFIALALVYLVGRFALGNWMSEAIAYGSYIFELIILGVYFYLLKKRFLDELKIDKLYLFISIGALGLGLGAYEFAISKSILIPFQLDGAETIFFLLIVAPVLEELLFHSLLWKPLEDKPKVAFAVTAILFSFAHYHAIWFYPELVHGFIKYQAIYTLGLGLLCGIPVYLSRSVAGAMLIHFGFNLGFFLAYVL